MNKEETREYNRQYYLKNKNKIIENVKIYSEKNSEKLKEYQKNYRDKNKDKLKKYKEEWLDLNKEKMRLYYRDRKRNKLKNDEFFKFTNSIRKRTNQAFKVSSWKKDSSNESLLGCSFKEAKKHIENQFQEGMNWDNYGKKGWHIDHIIPLCSAKTQYDFEKLCNIKNLQPLWAFDNLSKGGKH